MERANKITSSEQNLSVISAEFVDNEGKHKEKEKKKPHAAKSNTKPESSLSSYKQIDLNPRTPDPELIETGFVYIIDILDSKLIVNYMLK